MNKSWRSHKGSHQIKKGPKIWKKSKRGGGGVSTKNQKDQNLKFGLFDERGGGYIFIFPPNVNVNFKYSDEQKIS